MKSVFALSLLCIISHSLSAQTEPADSMTDTSINRWVYCQILGTKKLFSLKVTVEIDYGQRKSLFSDERIKAEDGKVKSFNSMVDAMNYLGDKGWEFVQAYVVTVGDQNVYHWLLKADKNGPVFFPDRMKPKKN